MAIKAEGSTKYTFEIAEVGAEQALATIKSLQSALDQLRSSAKAPINIDIAMSKGAESLFRNNKNLLTEAMRSGKTLGEAVNEGLEKAIKGDKKTAKSTAKKLTETKKQADEQLTKYIDKNEKKLAESNKGLDEQIGWVDKQTDRLQTAYQKFDEAKQAVTKAKTPEEKAAATKALQQQAQELIADVDNTIDERGNAIWQKAGDQMSKVMDIRDKAAEHLNKEYLKANPKALENIQLESGMDWADAVGDDVIGTDDNKAINQLKDKLKANRDAGTDLIRQKNDMMIEQQDQIKESIAKAKQIKSDIKKAVSTDEVKSAMSTLAEFEDWEPEITEETPANTKTNNKREATIDKLQKNITANKAQVAANNRMAEKQSAWLMDEQLANVQKAFDKFEKANSRAEPNVSAEQTYKDYVDRINNTALNTVAEIDNALQGRERLSEDVVQDLTDKRQKAVKKLNKHYFEGEEYSGIYDEIMKNPDWDPENDIYDPDYRVKNDKGNKIESETLANSLKDRTEKIKRNAKARQRTDYEAESADLQKAISAQEQAIEEIYKASSDAETEGILKNLQSTLSKNPEAAKKKAESRAAVPEAFKNPKALADTFLDYLQPIEGDFNSYKSEGNLADLQNALEDVKYSVEDNSMGSKSFSDLIGNSLKGLNKLSGKQAEEFANVIKKGAEGFDDKSPTQTVSAVKDALQGIAKNYTNLSSDALKQIDGIDTKAIAKEQEALKAKVAEATAPIVPQVETNASQQNDSFAKSLDSIIKASPDDVTKTINFEVNPPAAQILSEINEIKSALDDASKKVTIKVNVDLSEAQKKINSLQSLTEQATTKSKKAKAETSAADGKDAVVVETNAEDIASKFKDLKGNVTFESNISEFESKVADLKGKITFDANIGDIINEIERADKKLKIAQNLNLDTRLQPKTQTAKTAASPVKKAVKEAVADQKTLAKETQNTAFAVEQGNARLLQAVNDYEGTYGHTTNKVFKASRDSEHVANEAMNLLAAQESIDPETMQAIQKSYPETFKKISENAAHAKKMLNMFARTENNRKNKVFDDDFKKALKTAPQDVLEDPERWEKQIQAQAQSFKDAQQKALAEAQEEAEAKATKTAKETKSATKSKQEVAEPKKETVKAKSKQTTAQDEDSLSQGLKLTGELAKGDNNFVINVQANGVEEARSSLASLVPAIESLRSATQNPIALNIKMSEDAKKLVGGNSSFLQKFEDSGHQIGSSIAKGLSNGVGKSGGGPKKAKAASLVDSYIQEQKAKIKSLTEDSIAYYKSFSETAKDTLNKSWGEFEAQQKNLTDEDKFLPESAKDAVKKATSFLQRADSYTEQELQELKQKSPAFGKKLDQRRAEAVKYLNQYSASQKGASAEELEAVSDSSLIDEKLAARVQKKAESYRNTRLNGKNATKALAEEETRQKELALRKDNLRTAQKAQKRIAATSSDFETTGILKQLAQDLDPTETSVDRSAKAVANNFMGKVSDAFNSFQANKGTGGDLTDFYKKMADQAVGGANGKTVGDYLLDSYQKMNKMSDQSLSSMAKQMSFTNPDQFKDLSVKDLKQIRSVMGDMASDYSNVVMDGMKGVDEAQLQAMQKAQATFNKNYDKMYSKGGDAFTPDLGQNLGSADMGKKLNSIVSSANEVNVPEIDIKIKMTPSAEEISSKLNDIKSTLSSFTSEEKKINFTTNVDEITSKVEALKSQLASATSEATKPVETSLASKTETKTETKTEPTKVVDTSSAVKGSEEISKITAPSGEVTGTVTAADIKGESGQISSATVQNIEVADTDPISLKAVIQSIENIKDSASQMVELNAEIRDVVVKNEQTVQLMAEIIGVKNAEGNETTVPVKAEAVDVKVSDDGAPIKVRAEADDVKVSDDGAPIKVRAEADNVEVRDDGAPVHVKAVADDVQVQDDGSPVHVKAIADDVQVQDDGSPVHVKAIADDVQITDDGKPIQVKAEASDVTVKEGSVVKVFAEITGIKTGDSTQTVKVHAEVSDMKMPEDKVVKVKTQAEGKIDSEQLAEQVAKTQGHVTFETNVEEIRSQLNSMTGYVTFDSNISELQSQLNSMKGHAGSGKAVDTAAAKIADSVVEKTESAPTHELVDKGRIVAPAPKAKEVAEAAPIQTVKTEAEQKVLKPLKVDVQNENSLPVEMAENKPIEVKGANNKPVEVKEKAVSSQESAPVQEPEAVQALRGKKQDYTSLTARKMQDQIFDHIDRSVKEGVPFDQLNKVYGKALDKLPELDQASQRAANNPTGKKLFSRKNNQQIADSLTQEVSGLLKEATETRFKLRTGRTEAPAPAPVEMPKEVVQEIKQVKKESAPATTQVVQTESNKPAEVSIANRKPIEVVPTQPQTQTESKPQTIEEPKAAAPKATNVPVVSGIPASQPTPSLPKSKAPTVRPEDIKPSVQTAAQETANAISQATAKNFTHLEADTTTTSALDALRERVAFDPKTKYAKSYYDGAMQVLENRLNSDQYVPAQEYAEMLEKRFADIQKYDKMVAGKASSKDIQAFQSEMNRRYEDERRNLDKKYKAYDTPRPKERLGTFSAEEIEAEGFHSKAQGKARQRAIESVVTKAMQDANENPQGTYVKNTKSMTGNNSHSMSVKYADGDNAVTANFRTIGYKDINGRDAVAVYRGQKTIAPNDLLTGGKLTQYIDNAHKALGEIQDIYADKDKYIRSHDFQEAIEQGAEIEQDLIRQLSEPGMTERKAQQVIDKATKGRLRTLKALSKGLETQNFLGTTDSDFLNSANALSGADRKAYLESKLTKLFSDKYNNSGEVKLLSEKNGGFIVERTADGTKTTSKVNYSQFQDTEGTNRLSFTSRQIGSEVPKSALAQWGSTIAGKFKSLTQYLTSMYLAQKLMGEISSGMQFVQSSDKAMTNIGMTMNASAEQLDTLKQKAIETGVDLKTNATNVIEAATVYANANETADSILEKAKPTMLLANASGQSASVAADQIQAINLVAVQSNLYQRIFLIAGNALEPLTTTTEKSFVMV